MHHLYITSMQSPIGLIVIQANDEAIISVQFADTPLPVDEHVPNHVHECVRQLTEYFAGKRTAFTVPIQPEGTDFQENVWKVLQEIGYAGTSTYLELSKLLGDENKSRAVGAATGANPIAVIVPCHRVIGSDGSLTGYMGGLHRKQWLLEHEALHGRGVQRLFDRD
ncbi:MAG TPA: methylated-DNA--[protein]-cysteine S-methyltransferase [Chitinophagales bacterium]|jgi:methylated-DNA-[protein]-cysteine S-methyltransferase|nr:methylated-DNA--[protein]-cysteine S-methyltransferase [Chitinophagales bacterium]